MNLDSVSQLAQLIEREMAAPEKAAPPTRKPMTRWEYRWHMMRHRWWYRWKELRDRVRAVKHAAQGRKFDDWDDEYWS